MKFEVMDIDFDDCGRVSKTELSRIRALVDIPRHGVRKGDIGGFVSAQRNLSQQGDCWIAGDAQVTDDAFVTGNALVADTADLCDYAIALGNAVVEDEADVADRAIISENANVAGRARIFGQSLIEGRSIVCDDALVGGECIVTDDARVWKTAHVTENGVANRSVNLQGRRDITSPIYGVDWYKDHERPDILEAASIRQSMIDLLDDFGWHYDLTGQIRRSNTLNLHITMRELRAAINMARIWRCSAPSFELSSNNNHLAMQTFVGYFDVCLASPTCSSVPIRSVDAAINEWITNFGPDTVAGVIKENVTALRQNHQVSYGWKKVPTDTSVIAEEKAKSVRFSYWSKPVAFDREKLRHRIQWINDDEVRMAQRGLRDVLRIHAVRERDRRLLKSHIDHWNYYFDKAG